MVFGILKDKKDGEHRVISTPREVRSIVAAGHRVIAESSCGYTAGFDDEEYASAGAEIVDSAADVWQRCDVVAKVKEFTPSECKMMRRGQIILGCIHPAANPEEVSAILDAGVIAFTLEDSHRFGSPNCEAAGKQGALFGLESMLTINGGAGKFVGGFAGAAAMRVLILGAGAVGRGALEVLYALGARCTVMDINRSALCELLSKYSSHIDTMICSKEAIASLLPRMDMVVNCVRWDKSRRDFLIDKEMVSTMSRGSVIVDISNDSPGAIETSRTTSHSAPRYIERGVVHYCVSNIPGAVAHSASCAYAASVLPMILSILGDGVSECCRKDGFYRRSLMAYRGYLTHEETSVVQNRPWISPEDILGFAGAPLDFAPPATSQKSSNFYKF